MCTLRTEGFDDSQRMIFDRNRDLYARFMNNPVQGFGQQRISPVISQAITGGR